MNNLNVLTWGIPKFTMLLSESYPAYEQLNCVGFPNGKLFMKILVMDN